MLKVRTSTGMVIEGEETEVLRALNQLGLDKESFMYKSSSRGWLVISEMQSDHLRNAILKSYQQWVDSLHAIKNPKELVEKIVEGCPDKTFVAMVLELSKRK